MLKFVIFALYLCVSATLLVVWPVMAHPNLSRRQKRLISLIAFVVFVPIGLGLYAWLGAPQLAGRE